MTELEEKSLLKYARYTAFLDKGAHVHSIEHWAVDSGQCPLDIERIYLKDCLDKVN